MKPGSLIAATIFSLMAVGHVLRLVFRVPVTVDGFSIPLWISAVSAVVLVALAAVLWRESRPSPLQAS